MNHIIAHFFLMLSIALLLLTAHRNKRSCFILKLIPGALLGLCLSTLADYLLHMPSPFFYAAFYLTILYVGLWIFGMVEIPFYLYAIYFIAALVLQDGTYNVYVIVYYMLGLDDLAWLSWLMHWIVIAVCYCIAYWIIVRPLKYEGEDRLYIHSSIAALVIFLINQIEAMFIISSDHYFWNNLEVRVYSVIVSALALAIQFGFFQQNQMEREKEALNQLLYQERKQHALSKEVIDLINIKSHDLKHQIAAIRRIGSLEAQQKELAEIEEAVMIYDSAVKTQNAALDIVLMEKGLICKNRQITLACMVDGTALHFIQDTDIYSLFGNILDNAIESVSREEDLEKRFVSLEVSQRGAIVVIHAENYCGQKLTFRDGLPETTNEDKRYHGYGMKNIRYLTEKYRGTMSASQDGTQFILNLIFQVIKP